MDIITTHFLLDKTEFAKVLYDTNAFLSGGSVLNAFLSENINDDQDLDIFIRIPENNSGYIKGNYYPYEIFVKEKINNFLHSHNYVLDTNYYPIDLDNNPYDKSSISKFIKNVNQYKNGNLRIQIIILYDCCITNFLQTFDLNICRLVICVDKEYNFEFYHKINPYLSKEELDHISSKQMYLHMPNNILNLCIRIKKYLCRGFKLMIPIKVKKDVLKVTDINDYTDFVDNFEKKDVLKVTDIMDVEKAKLSSNDSFETIKNYIDKNYELLCQCRGYIR